MKIDKIISDEPDRLQIVAQVPAKTQKLINQIIPHKGHVLFEINPITGKCKLAEYESIDAKLNGGISRKVVAKDGCVYVSALNKKNALIKFFKMVSKQMEKNKK